MSASAAMPMAGAEQRNDERFVLPLAVRGTDPLASAETVTSTSNISATGVYPALRRKAEVGTELEWEITFPSELSASRIRIRCRGKIVRVERPDAAGQIGVAAALESCEFVREPAPALKIQAST